MGLERVREMAERLGPYAALENVACRAANRITEVRIIKGVYLTMETVDPKFLVEEAGYRWGFLDGPALSRALESTPESDMDAAFVEQALARGDRCYAAMDGDVLASYGWYATRPTPITVVSDDMMLYFDSAYAYMYKGYTLPAHRGKRLHGIGMARAMRAHVEEGKAGLVSCVESHNLPSLISCHRLGYRDFGQIVCIRLGGRYLICATKGCRAYGFHARLAGAAA